MEKEVKILSASRLKTLEDCAWEYWCQYVLKLPSKGNDGSARGTACHLVFEVLLNERHRHHFDKITKENTIYTSPSIVKLVKKSLNRDGFYSEENLKMCNDMILVGLNYDFYAKGGKVLCGEQEFLLESDDPEYKARGFIDKPVKYKGGVIKLVDYKTSKNKKTPSELDGDYQSMMYSLAAKDLSAKKEAGWPKNIKKIVAEFLFLRFPDDPSQQVEASEDQLKGFEYYLADAYDKINNFDRDLATSNYAKDQPRSKDGSFCGPLKCGFAKKPGQLKKNGLPMYFCEYKFPFDYYILKDKNGKQIASAMHPDFLLKKNESDTIEKKSYEGCPAHRHLFEEPKDAFDF